MTGRGEDMFIWTLPLRPCYPSWPSFPLFSFLCPPSKNTRVVHKNSMIAACTMMQHYPAACRLSSYLQSRSVLNATNTLLASVVKHFPERAEAARSLFNPAFLCAAEQSSSDSSQARKRLHTSASGERGVGVTERKTKREANRDPEWETEQVGCFKVTKMPFSEVNKQTNLSSCQPLSPSAQRHFVAE